MNRRMDNNAYLRIGEEVGRVIGYKMPLSQVAEVMGIRSKQLAYYYANVALGKVIHRLRQSMEERR